MQSRWISLLEAGLNVMAGVVLSFLLQLALFRAMGITASIGQNLLVTAAFSALSLARGYVLRRLFNGLAPEAHRAITHPSARTNP